MLKTKELGFTNLSHLKPTFDTMHTQWLALIFSYFLSQLLFMTRPLVPVITLLLDN